MSSRNAFRHNSAGSFITSSEIPTRHNREIRDLAQGGKVRSEPPTTGNSEHVTTLSQSARWWSRVTGNPHDDPVPWHNQEGVKVEISDLKFPTKRE